MRDIIAKLTASAFLMSVFIVTPLMTSPASAHMKIWNHVGNWTIWSDIDNHSCVAVTKFKSGKKFMLGFIDESARFAFGNLNVKQGQKYDVPMSFEGYGRGIFHGIATDSHTITFENMQPSALDAFMQSSAVTVGSFGTYSLAGSAQAIMAARNCYKAEPTQ